MFESFEMTWSHIETTDVLLEPIEVPWNRVKIVWMAEVVFEPVRNGIRTVLSGLKL